MSKIRTAINVASFLLLSGGLIFFGVSNFIIEQEMGNVLYADFTDASGLLGRNDVTMRGVVVGSVEDVQLNDDHLARVKVVLDPGVEVPEGTTGEVVRRSPIGELTLELDPGDGEPLASGATLGVEDTTPPPDVAKTIEVLADVLHEVPSEDLGTLVDELAAGLRGRGEDIARLNVAAADLPERLLEVEAELEDLIRTGPKVTGVFADNARTLADDITQTAVLADILRDNRYNLLDLYRNGARFTTVAGDLIGSEKANLACLIRDFGDINTVMARPQNLENLARVLEDNHYFFGAVEQSVQRGLDTFMWFRVQLLPHTEPQGRNYEPHRPYPDVYGGNACSSRYGPGVGPGSQAHEFRTAPDSSLNLGR
jgi:phospholipid/cholesterol/gamma-HCH transport system substrate-binding protein